MVLHRKLSFASLCLAFFLVMLDTTLVPFLYPVLLSELGLSVAEAAAVNNYFLIAYAGTLLLGGKLGDFSNRKRVFLTGIALLTIGALFAAISGAYAVLLFGRFAMGVGAGLITPQSMAFISQLFKEEERGPVFGIWAAVAGLGTALGPVVAKFSEYVNFWQLAFWINVVLAVVAFSIAASTLERAPLRSQLTAPKVLVPALVGVATMALFSSAQMFTSQPLTAPKPYFFLSITVILGAVAWQLVKRSGFPGLIRLEKIEVVPYVAAVLGSACLGGGLTAYYLPLSLSFEYVWDFGELTTISLMVFSSLMNSIFGLLAGGWSNKWGRKNLIISGMTVFGVACFLLGLFSVFSNGEESLIVGVVAGLVGLVGVGAGLAFGPLANSSMAAAADDAAAEAAAFYNWTRQVFSAAGGVGVASISSFILHDHGSSNVEIVSYSSLAGFVAVGLMLLIGAVISTRIKNDY